MHLHLTIQIIGHMNTALCNLYVVHPYYLLIQNVGNMSIVHLHLVIHIVGHMIEYNVMQSAHSSFIKDYTHTTSLAILN